MWNVRLAAASDSNELADRAQTQSEVRGFMGALRRVSVWLSVSAEAVWETGAAGDKRNDEGEGENKTRGAILGCMRQDLYFFEIGLCTSASGTCGNFTDEEWRRGKV